MLPVFNLRNHMTFENCLSLLSSLHNAISTRFLHLIVTINIPEQQTWFIAFKDIKLHSGMIIDNIYMLIANFIQILTIVIYQ